MKIKFRENKLLTKDNFPEVLQKALKNLDDYEFSEFEWEKEWQLGYIRYLEEIMDSIIKGFALKIDVDPLSIQKSFHIPTVDLLKAANGEITEGSLLMKSLWQKLKEKYTKTVNWFKKFMFNKGEPLKPMKIPGTFNYNPANKILQDDQWKNIETSIIDFMKDTIKDPNEEIAIKSGLFGLLRKKMDDEGIPVEDQKRMTYDDIVNKFGNKINDTEKMYEEISKDKIMKAAIEYSKNHGAEHLAIDNGTIKNKIVTLMRKQITGALEEGLSPQELISRLYWIDPTDELGKQFSDYTVDAWNRDLRRIAITEFSYSSNNGYLAANQAAVKKGEKLYFVFNGQHNPDEKPNEPCNSYLGKIGLLIDKPQGSEEIDDPMADYAIWYGKSNVGRKKNDWQFTIPVHPNSFNKDTDIYTKDGWKNVTKLTEKDLFLSLNPDTKNIEYVKVKKVYKHKEKELLRFYNFISDICVTKNHDMFYQKDQDRKEKTGKFIFKKAINLYGKKSGRFYAGCEWETKNKKISDCWYEFFGYYLSDGWTEKISEKNYWIEIAKNKEKKPKKYNKILKCLEKISKTKVSQSKDKLRFRNDKLGKYLYSFGKCNKKYIPNFIMNSQKEKIKLFLNAYLMCDRHYREKKNKLGFISKEKKYFTTSKKVADQLSELILKVGKRPSISIQKPNNKLLNFPNGQYKSKLNLYIVGENNHIYINFGSMKYEKIKYNNYVYCVELEKYHTLWTKRNGKTLWSGNCTHYWERINPKIQQYNDEIGKVEFKTDEIKKSFSLDNVEWSRNKENLISKQLPEFIKNVKKQLKIDFPIIVRLYKEHKDGPDIRSMHDEGIIILYESTPDWKGDLLHEIGHLYFHLIKISENKNIVDNLLKIKKSLESENNFNLIFNNSHTSKDIKEIFATIFKWYISGKIIDKMFLDVVSRYVPGSLNFIYDIFENATLQKSIDLSNTLAFDFDKVISTYDGWKGPEVFGKPIKKTIKDMKYYKEKGFKIIIFTTREDNSAIRKWLKDNNVTYDEFIGNKPFYNCFVDDKTVNNIIHKKNLRETIDHVLSLDNDLKKSELKNFDLIKNDKTKLKMNYEGISINIEWMQGETREYPGSPYKNHMIDHHYGYVRNTDSPDGEDIDVYIHIPIDKNAPIYMLNQLHANNKYSGEFDEHKFMIGYPSAKKAKESYIRTMQKNMYGGMTKISLDNFKKNILPFYKK